MGDIPFDPVTVTPPFYRNEKFLSVTVLVLFAVFLFIRLDLADILIRPYAMKYGQAGAVRIVTKSERRGKYDSGYYLGVVFSDAPPDAQAYHLKVNGVAYETLPKDVVVSMHYIPGCPSCIVLDEDYGSALQFGLIDLVYIGIAVGALFLGKKKKPETAA
ncbi:MAG: hypothetical protein ACHQ51_09180 [Elusimicrobiota bacterium]